ncbi:SGNH/GDSL hydrolase family protein [Brevibacterium litoralis]|uniref:SGNH/GDSL hydrolase family protein n=1 Tax=Brevibacterium litoralis TaxID=3138935 RepID=UPI0032EF6661
MDDDRWTAMNMVYGGAGRIGLVAELTGPYSVGFTSSYAHTGAVWKVRASSGATVTFSVDGTKTRYTLAAEVGWQNIDAGELVDDVHTMSMSSSEPIDVLGVVLTYPRQGLRVTKFARGGSAAIHWRDSRPCATWASLTDHVKPDALFVGLGTNRPTDVAGIQELYDKVAALKVPVVVVSPGGLGSSTRPRQDIEPMMSKLYEVAQLHDWPLIDFEQVIGEFDEARRAGLMVDAVHENSRANALEAWALRTLIT